MTIRSLRGWLTSQHRHEPSVSICALNSSARNQRSIGVLLSTCAPVSVITKLRSNPANAGACHQRFGGEHHTGLQQLLQTMVAERPDLGVADRQDESREGSADAVTKGMILSQTHVGIGGAFSSAT